MDRQDVLFCCERRPLAAMRTRPALDCVMSESCVCQMSKLRSMRNDDRGMGAKCVVGVDVTVVAHLLR